MKTIRTYSNLAEAGFASSLIEAAGIPTLLADEQNFLFSYGMATGGIRLQVEDADFDRASQVLESGPAALPEQTSDISSIDHESLPKGNGNIPVGIFVAGAAVLVLLAIVIRNQTERKRTIASRPSEQTYPFDYNHDGRPDRFFTYRGDRITHAEMDRNGDGAIDEWEFYDQEGRVERVESDNNFDGRTDEWFTFKNSLPETSRRDSDFDGRPDLFGSFQNGIIAQEDVRPNESAVILRRDIFVHGILREELVDEDRDGNFDFKRSYDPFGTEGDRSPIQRAK